MFEVVISKQAKADLEGIYEYIAITLLSPQNAVGQLVRLEQKIMELDQMPMRYKKYQMEPWQSRGMRIMPVDNFVVLYIPDEKAGVVTIIRVIYGGRNVEEQLKPR